jgi:hypothetical protein
MADVNGFFMPNALGFDIPNSDLRMRLFPVDESIDAYAGNVDAGRLFEYMKVPNARTIFGENMRFMPGIIWSCSLGGPPIPHGLNMLNPAHLNEVIIAPNVNVYDWLRKYAINQICNVAAHVFYYNSAGNWGGLNFYMDVTENTLLTKVFNASMVLNILQGSTPNYSLVELDGNEEEVRRCITEAMEWVNGIVPQDVNLPLWKILSIAIYALFRRIKVGRIGHEWRAPIEDDAYDYNLRIYLVKRIGRFNGGPLPATVWLAMAQYYRFFTVFQRRFQINYGAGDTDIHVVKRFVTRDAHASTSSSFSETFDTLFFNNAAASGMRTIMLGINPQYKLKRHAKLADGADTWVRPVNDARFSRNSFGVLAGACWFYNPTDTFLCNPDIYTIFLLPFQPLQNHNGVLVPAGFKAIDRADVLSQMPNFFTYGLDEYILSEFANQHFNNEDKWNEINLLFFTIHWIGSILGEGDAGEYYPLLKYGLALERPLFGDITSLSTLIYNLASRDPSQFSIAPYFNTLFGNDGNIQYRVQTARSQMEDPNLVEYNNIAAMFLNTFRGCMLGWQLDIPCVLDHCHRYDRPLYWKGGLYGERHYSLSQRITGGIKSIPNNRKLNIHIATQAIIPYVYIGMTADDRVGVPGDPADKFCPAGPNIILGGKRKKIRKTRKHHKKHTKKGLTRRR